MPKLLLALTFLFLTSTFTRPADAAIVYFTGVFESSSGNTAGSLGDVPPFLDFEVSFEFTQSSPGFGSIQSGLLTTSVADIPIVGGDITLLESGSNDTGLFFINTSGPSGSLAATFTGDAIVDNQVTSENLIALINASAPSTISADFGANGNYTGRVLSAVPEPSSLFAVAGAGCIGLLRRRRRIV